MTNDRVCSYVKNTVDNERISIGNHPEVTAEDDRKEWLEQKLRHSSEPWLTILTMWAELMWQSICWRNQLEKCLVFWPCLFLSLFSMRSYFSDLLSGWERRQDEWAQHCRHADFTFSYVAKSVDTGTVVFIIPPEVYYTCWSVSWHLEEWMQLYRTRYPI